jgi:hypothetical protein
LGISATTKTGQFGQGWQVDSQTIEKSLLASRGTSHFAALLDMNGNGLAAPFAHLLKSYKDNGPVPHPQNTLPVHAIKLASASCLDPTAAPSNLAVTNINVLTFILLQVGKYACPHGWVVTPQSNSKSVSDVCHFW